MDPACRVANVPGKGRGVFAARAIRQGEVVERSPVIVLPSSQVDLLEQTLLDEYVFIWGAARDQVAVALGVGSLFNHSFAPNLVYTRELDTDTLVFTALVDVDAGHELLINYNGDPANLDPVWFELAR